jgi:hypothetical protein
MFPGLYLPRCCGCNLGARSAKAYLALLRRNHVYNDDFDGFVMLKVLVIIMYPIEHSCSITIMKYSYSTNKFAHLQKANHILSRKRGLVQARGSSRSVSCEA